MKIFVTLSALLSAAVAFPHHGTGNHQHYFQQQPIQRQQAFAYGGLPSFVPNYAPQQYRAVPQQQQQQYRVVPQQQQQQYRVVPQQQQQYIQAAATVLPYHSEAEADCHPEKEVFNVQSCLPNFQVKCDDYELEQNTISYVKKCTDVTSQVCGNHHPIAVSMEENADDTTLAAVSDNALPVENKVYYIMPGTPMLKHKCWDVPQQHCYLEPIVEQQSTTVPKCHVVSEPVCTETSHEVNKVVCNKEKTAAVGPTRDNSNLHVHKDGVAHSHLGGDMTHDHMKDPSVAHKHQDGTQHTHIAGAIPHEHEGHEHTHTHEDGTTHEHPHKEGHHDKAEHVHKDGVVHTHLGGDMTHDHMKDPSVAHKHQDGTQHTHTAGAIPHEHEGHEHTHTHEDGTTHSHNHAEKHHAAFAHVHEHAHTDGTVHAHTHTAYHHASPYKAYYYYPKQNLNSQLGLYNIYGK